MPSGKAGKRKPSTRPKTEKRTQEGATLSSATPSRPQPRPQAGANYYRSAAIFALGVVAVAAMLFAVVREIGSDRVVVPPQVVNDDPLFAELKKRREFKEWLTAWRTVDPYVTVSEFTAFRRGALQTARPPEFARTPSPDALTPPRANRYVWSPDKTRFVDYLGSYGEPDSGVELYDRAGDGKIEMLAFCGTPCRFDGAFWLDADRVAVLGITEGHKEDGGPLCVAASEGSDGPRLCYHRLTATVYDLAEDTQVTYRSENHLLVVNPFEADARERWMSGLTAEELAIVGHARPGATERVSGTIIDLAASARILTLGGGKVPRFLAVSGEAAILDEDGRTVRLEDLQAGFTVEAVAVVGADGSLLANVVKVLSAPKIIVHEPTDGTDVAARFTARGMARTFEGTVNLRVTNVRTGKVVLERFTTAAATEAGAFGPFSIALRLPSGSARAGDGLTLEAYQISAEDGEEIDKTVITLTYRP